MLNEKYPCLKVVIVYLPDTIVFLKKIILLYFKEFKSKLFLTKTSILSRLKQSAYIKKNPFLE